MIIGPVRSGVALDTPGHIVILGDVNPGAEIRAGGNIVVLGALRGIAHAARGGDDGFILALKLAPQQLRIGGLIARAGDADVPAGAAEIAYATGGQIIVETYQGRLPGGFAAARR
jgi:septum site-determining protein MinC